MAAFAPLSVRVDGETATDLRFQAADFTDPAQATRAEIRDAINRQTKKLVATIDGNHLVLTSTGEVARQRRDWTSLQVTAANATLGFAAGAQPTRGTVANRATTGTQLASGDAFEVGESVIVTDGQRTATAKIVRLTPSGEVEWTPAIATINTFDAFDTTITAARFDLTVHRGGPEAAQVVETLPALSMEADVSRNVVKVVNDGLRGSKYVLATDFRSAGGAGANLPAPLAPTRFVEVRDGAPTPADFIGDPAARTGFNAFDPFDVQLVCLRAHRPRRSPTAALAYCDGARRLHVRRRRCPRRFVGGAARRSPTARRSRAKKVYGALYGPWIVGRPTRSAVGDARGSTIPPVGHVMGVYARIETDARHLEGAGRRRGEPARRARRRDAAVRRRSHRPRQERQRQRHPRGAAAPASSSTPRARCRTDTRWLYVNVRLLFNFVKSSLRTGLRWVAPGAQPRHAVERRQVRHASRRSCMGLWRQGAFGTGTPEQTFTVIVDATNNPPDQVEQGQLKVEVYFYPSARPRRS